MEVAVVPVGVVEDAPHREVLVVAVRDEVGPGRVLTRALDGSAAGGAPPVDLQPVLRRWRPVGRVEVPVVEIIRVIAVTDLPMPAPRPVVMLVTLALVFVQGCRLSPPDAGAMPDGRQGRPVAAATIAPLAGLVARVAGPGWEVRTVVPPGTSPHVFEPAPRDVRQIAGARLAVVVGAGYDGWAARLLAACASDAVLHDAGASVGLFADEHEADGHGHGHAHGEAAVDPHWWLSAELAARSLSPIAERLAAIDPAGAVGYRDRAARGAEALRRLDAELLLVLAPVRGRSFVSAHRAWDTFSARYGLVPSGAIEPVPGREPSPREVRDLVAAVRGGGLSRLFTEPQFPATAARVIAGEAGVAISLVDPIGGVTGRRTYEELMRFNAAAFVDALSSPGGRG